MMTALTPKSADDIHGFEYDWLGRDEDGHVALFSTAGAGCAPSGFLQDTGAHDAAIDAILALPESTAARFAPSFNSDVVNTWKLAAERGLYAFDSDPAGGPYRLVAAPVVPIQAESLPVVATVAVDRVRLGFCFASQTVVTADQIRNA